MIDIDNEMLIELKNQHAGLVAQKEQSVINLQQLIGAIFAYENIIKTHEEKIKYKEEGADISQESGEFEHVQVN